MLVRAESIITQLVFDHSLRIRMKSETPTSPPASRATSAAQTPDNASLAEGESATAQSSLEETLRASTASTASKKGKGKDKDAKKPEDASADAPAAEASTGGNGNSVGKINNLVTADLDTLVDGRDFLFVSASLAT